VVYTSVIKDTFCCGGFAGINVGGDTKVALKA
jgi:hypothetical protein